MHLFQSGDHQKPHHQNEAANSPASVRRSQEILCQGAVKYAAGKRALLFFSGDDKGANAVAQGKMPETYSLDGIDCDHLPGIFADKVKDMIH